MVYNPFQWQDDPDGDTPITAERLNAIEQGLYAASKTAEEAKAGVSSGSTGGTTGGTTGSVDGSSQVDYTSAVTTTAIDNAPAV